MKITISYPPLHSEKGVPLLSQNRQFQYFNSPTYIYPVVPAYAATMLSNAGYEVVWDDGIAEEKLYNRWLSDLENVRPDVMMIETKTPVVKKHWSIINEVKKVLPDTKIVLVGDHVTALPQESMEQSKVDFILTGGDYDFLIVNLVDFLSGKTKLLEPGIWYRENETIKNTGQFKLNHDLNELPFINRDLTHWQLYSERNGNFKVTPGAYTMAGRDCWWRKDGGCTFCSWPTLYPTFRVMKPERLADEVGFLIEKYKVKSVFDDTGCFPVGEWLKQFANLMIERGYNKKIQFSCNMRFGALNRENYRLLKKAGFRMLLFGIESGSQATLDRLNKGTTVDGILNECRVPREEGLEPHITIMVGYPWETRKDAQSTLNLAKILMQKGWAVTLQSTVVIPYPGSKLYAEAVNNHWFRINATDYDRFDMKEPVMITPDMTPEEVMKLCDEIYKVFLSPQYMLKQIVRIRSLRDIRYSIKGAAKVLGHVKDFGESG
ncbi:MAG: B12-binding domain-containing radical SAM protein [Candidatus Bathyarchaeota archaeon]|nr:B12-binding domain-containing radical SAM protein [Candidatus Bathyarchaeota archaeon]